MRSTLAVVAFLAIFLQSAVVEGRSISDTPDFRWLSYLAKSAQFRLNALIATKNLYSADTLVLGNQIKEALLTPGIPDDIAQNFTSIKNKLPTNVRMITFGETVYLVNRNYSEFLYTAMNDLSHDAERRNIYTWAADQKDRQGFFRFNTMDDGKTFSLESMYFKEFLYADTNEKAYDKERRQVFSWRPKGPVEGMQWTVELVNDDEIILRSHTYDEVLYAEVDKYARDHRRRRVFTKRGQSNGDFGDQMYWKVVAGVQTTTLMQNMPEH